MKKIISILITLALLLSMAVPSFAGTDYYQGKFLITHYCNCVKCCGKYAGGATASGNMPVDGYSIAADKKYPFGTKLYIEGSYGVTWKEVQDRGGGVKGNHIDIYVNNHQLARYLGKYYATVWLRKE